MDWIDKHEDAAFSMVDSLDVSTLEPGLHRLGVHLVSDAAARPVYVPTLVARGHADGPVVGLTAVVHGNELNGVPTIHRLFATIEPAHLAGTVVGATIINVPAYLRNTRVFPDGADLNRLMPGIADGNESEVYAHRLATRLLDPFDVLIDLHTASFGRVNTLYVRADMNDLPTASLARAVGAEVIVHNEPGDGTLRDYVAARGRPAITVEIGDPQIIDHDKIRISRIGIRDVLENLGMLPQDEQSAPEGAVECVRSYWLHTDCGGFLEVAPELGAEVEHSEVIAVLRDPWGHKLRTYRAPESGVVVGRGTNPVCRTGSRILHLGIFG